MINILLAILFSSCIIITFRLFSVFRVANLPAITINYLVAGVLSYIAYPGEIQYMQIIGSSWMPWALANGFLFIAVFFVFARSAQKAGVAITAVASKMSVIIPVSIGIFIYNDLLNSTKALGILMAFPAFYLIFSGRQKEPNKTSYFLLPVLLFFGTGANDSIMKHAQNYYVGDHYLLFLGTIFFISLLFGLAGLMVKSIRRHYKVVPEKSYYSYLKGLLTNWKVLLGGTVLGALNFASTMYFLKSVAIFESTVFFPVFNVSIVSMGAVIGLLLFKEKLLARNWAGIFVAIVTIILIAIA